MMCCIGRVEPELQDAYMKAVMMWFPHVAIVKEVRWCKEPEECERLKKDVAIAMYYESDHTISLVRSWAWGWNDYTLPLTLAHEYGHALGLQHVTGYSIMRKDWEQPIADNPTDLDWVELKKIEDARNQNIRSSYNH